MNTTALVAEFLVIGFVPFLTILFASFSVLGIYDLDPLLTLKDISAALVVAAVLPVYFLGAITHRLTLYINSRTLHSLLQFKVVRELLRQTESADQQVWFDERSILYQYGSEALINQMEFMASQLRIFKSTFVSMPLLTMVLAFWLLGSGGWQVAVFAVLVCVLLTMSAALSYIEARNSIVLAAKSGLEVIENERKGELTCKHDKDNE